MNVGIELPEDILRHLESAWQDVPRRALEAVVLEGYRSGALGRAEVGRLLGLSFWETEALLKERQAYLPYGDADLAQDRVVLDQALSE